jgi:alpha-L-fucosidase
MNRFRSIAGPIVTLALCFVLARYCHAVDAIPTDVVPTVSVKTATEPMASGKFEPTWDSLRQYETPQWFRDAKFGIWAHWGPQCEPEQGDWYARGMYQEGSRQYKFHLDHYGHPSKFGFKDVIHQWKAEHWNPDELLALYKRAGAQYFFALANHHDNFDLWASKHQPWNAAKLGPQKDLIAGWAKAARAQGMKFGVSVHAAHAWLWYEPAQGTDKNGPLAGVPYDGKLTAADGKGTWWEGLDPQALYAQAHDPSPNFLNPSSIHGRWNWRAGASIPDQAYCQNFYDRTVDLINQAQPDLVYFDDSALPLWPVSDAGLKIAAHFYNSNMKAHDGKLEAVLFGKILSEQQRKCMVWDIERGQSDKIEPLPWQTDTCIGGWHYDRSTYDKNRYKSAATVIRTLADVISKNGNLLLSVPVRGDGTIDEKERAIVESIAAWMDLNKEAVFGTRPWKVCGEGPQLAAAAPLSAQGFNEGKGKPATAADIRYTAKGNAIYAFVLAKPTGDVRLTSLGKSAKLLDGSVEKVEQLGTGEAKWQQTDDALAITPDVSRVDRDQTVVFRITTNPR